jgi:hypothetical protein
VVCVIEVSKRINQVHAQRLSLFSLGARQSLLNDFFLYCLPAISACQSLGMLKLTNGEPLFVGKAIKRVCPSIPATQLAA